MENIEDAGCTQGRRGIAGCPGDDAADSLQPGAKLGGGLRGIERGEARSVDRDPLIDQIPGKLPQRWGADGGDVRVWIALPHHAEGGNGEDDIAQGSRAEDDDSVHTKQPPFPRAQTAVV
jgi:hypothetical protein